MSVRVQAMELLVSSVMHSAGCALSPGEALRRTMEAVAGGLLLEHGPGLRDPCEKELVVNTPLPTTLPSPILCWDYKKEVVRHTTS